MIIFISINLLYSILLVIIFAIFRSIGKKNAGQHGKMLCDFVSEIEEIFTMEKVIALGVFKILPLTELFIAFLGEWVALFVGSNLVLGFCAVYPLLMGTIQKTMDWIDDKYNLELDLVAELYSLFYASLPYKLVYLNIEDTLIGFVVLGIKFTFKMIVYVIVPTIKENNRKKKLKGANSKVNQVVPAKLFEEQEKYSSKKKGGYQKPSSVGFETKVKVLEAPKVKD